MLTTRKTPFFVAVMPMQAVESVVVRARVVQVVLLVLPALQHRYRLHSGCGFR